MRAIEDFKGVALNAPKLSPLSQEDKEGQRQGVNLDEVADIFKKAFYDVYCDRTAPLATQEQTNELYELYPCNFLRACNIQLKNLSFLGFNKKHQSLTVILRDETGKTEAVATRRIRNAKGEIVEGKKWIRAEGSNNGFIPHRINRSDDVVFIAEGIAEVGIFEMLKASYICFQNAGELKNFEFNPLKEKILLEIKDKSLICFVDNDEVGQEGFNSFYQSINHTRIYQVRFKDRVKGYDLRDFIIELSKTKPRGEILPSLLSEIQNRKEKI